jgi:hypothetical protein
VDQEKGHIGCHPGISPQTDHYAICGLLKSYIHLVLVHLWLPEDLDHANADSAMGVDEYRTHHIDELLDVLNLFVLASDCLHCLLAHCLPNPYLPISLHDDIGVEQIVLIHCQLIIGELLYERSRSEC